MLAWYLWSSCKIFADSDSRLSLHIQQAIWTRGPASLSSSSEDPMDISPPPGPEPQGSPLLLPCAAPQALIPHVTEPKAQPRRHQIRVLKANLIVGAEAAYRRFQSVHARHSDNANLFYRLTASWTSSVLNQETPLREPFCPSLEGLPNAHVSSSCHRPKPSTWHLPSSSQDCGPLPPAELLFTLMPPSPKPPTPSARTSLCSDLSRLVSPPNATFRGLLHGRCRVAQPRTPWVTELLESVGFASILFGLPLHSSVTTVQE
ncbi:uncharacterized protein LOC105311352 isoform X1 [Pteropus vampyrus]|uniref:Uncharacterized protein LOC105311352 isoform X1 n=1 Tax=Pteropus vampyrus TaxID=132908 RepID=A0A6P3S0A6_PTEVA|nr:uncharacterized protein LOC105311352 isoform X1 [Pteropus vampyrus]